jgi:hypothetical protein
LTKRAREYGTAAEEVSGLLEALAVSRNRALVARAAHDSSAELAQAAARKAYAGLLAAAVPRLERASVAYAETVRRARLDVRIPKATLERATRRPSTQIYPRRLIARFRDDGFTMGEIRRLMPSRRHIANFDLQKYLRARVLPVPFSRYYHTIELNDLAALVGALASQHALQESAVPKLLGDLDGARAACTQAGRASAVQKLLGDAQPGADPEYLRFLSAAAQPLISGASTVDPFPHCLH